MPARLLRLLALLQTRREWAGPELAERLGVTTRTIRRDVDRLRALDYPVVATTGTAGGYRLTSGRNLPPLVLDDEEAVAVAIGLSTAAGGNVAGIEDASMRALGKLERVLPARLRPRLAALTSATEAIPGGEVPPADPAVLAVLASCARDHELVTFGYRSRADAPTLRRVEPHALVTVKGRWYLLAFDPDRDDWRSFRVDRIADPATTHRTFTPRELPEEDAAASLARSFATATYRWTAVVTVDVAAAELRERLPAALVGEVEEDGSGARVRISAESADLVVHDIATVAVVAEPRGVEAPPEIRDRLAGLAQRLAASASPVRTGSR
ncbi:MAG: transcriptional regulator [Pseudonocardiaceae bacterium]|nr:MAG: transcriptional regulator [Pseudonocardiaceae bacterium]